MWQLYSIQSYKKQRHWYWSKPVQTRNISSLGASQAKCVKIAYKLSFSSIEMHQSGFMPIEFMRQIGHTLFLA